jgi:nucleoside phosphorylase
MTTSNLGSVDLLVLAAYPPELVGMRRLLGEQLFGNVNGVAISCKTVGVGLPNATSGTTTRLMQLRPRGVVLVGTAGVYTGATANVGEVVVARRVHLVEPAECEGRAAMPDPMARTIECNAMMAAGLNHGRAPTLDLANTLVVTLDEALGGRVAQSTSCAVENLEAFGIANACALQNVPFACVMGISNRVGPTGRDEWRQYHKAAAQAACEVVNRWLLAGVMGLPHRASTP